MALAGIQSGGDPAREILARAQAAAGGKERLAKIRDLRRTARRSILGGRIQALQTTQAILPGTLRNEMTAGVSSVVVYLQEGAGWIRSAQGRIPLSESQVWEVKGTLLHLPEYVLQSDEWPGHSVRYGGTGDVNGVAADILEVSMERNVKARLWIGKDPALLLKMAYLENAARIEEIYSDFRLTGGLRVAWHTKILQDGELAAELSVTSLSYNNGLTPDALGR